MRFRQCTFYRRKYVIGRILIWQIENHFERMGQTEFRQVDVEPHLKEARELQ